MQETIGRDWATLSEVAGKVDSLKAVLDIERRIANWWGELPYPLATIYRRYKVTTEPKERLDTLLHFFELAAVYLATIGTSHVKLLRQDWQPVIAKWFHPAGAAGIERADFGFWISLAGASLKDVSRVASDKELRVSAIEMAAPDLHHAIYDGVLVCSGDAAVVVLKDRVAGVARNYMLWPESETLQGHGAAMRFLPGDTTEVWDKFKISGIEPIEIRLRKI